MYENKQSGSESVSWQQVIVCYHGKKVSSNIKLSHAYQRVRQRYLLNIAIDNQKRSYVGLCRAPTKTQFILHELM